jgi:hypothetical protein
LSTVRFPLRTWLSTIRVGFTSPFSDSLVTLHDSAPFCEEELEEEEEEEEDESPVCPHIPTQTNKPAPSITALIKY